MSDVQELKKKRDRLRKVTQLKEELPHLYGFPLYIWQDEFFKCTEQLQFIFKANQIGGSSIMIKKIIHYATEPKHWTIFNRKPKMMMYLYPDKNTATREWETKWQEFMPKGSMKDHEQYGWKETWDGKYIDSVQFYEGKNPDGTLKPGVILYFKTYGSGAENLQGSTIAIVACDEELPEDLFPELLTRITGSPMNAGAMYWQGCTPTKGQKYLADIQSGKTKLPASRVWTVSQYDCLYYANGEKSMWTKERIEQNKQRYPSQREIDIRVYGLFKPLDRLAITQFNPDKHVKPYHPIKGWEVYCGVDYGVGGPTGHPSSIVFVAVSPNYNAARVINCWKSAYGPGTKTTSLDDVIMRYLEMCKEIGIDQPTCTYYDPAAGSLGVLAERTGLGWLKANKEREHGFNLINSLFKNDMLILLKSSTNGVDELVDEIETATTESSSGAKKHNDDLLDGMRYATSSVPFNFENIKITQHDIDKPTRTNGRHELPDDDYNMDEIGDEIDEWNECYGS